MTKNWAILGTGTVSRKFAAGLGQMPGLGRVTVVASRTGANADRFAQSLGGAVATASYEEAVRRADVDIVYIATPPSEHAAQALMAIAAGKAVLIEKPFALDGAAARRIAEAARAARVFCMEAMWTRFLPLMAELRAQAASGAIGNLRAFQGSFMISNAPDPGSSLFDPARGGGALMHRGVYPLSLARDLLGPVTQVTARGRLGATGVDADCTLLLTHEGGAVSTLIASLRAPGPNDFVLCGTHGQLSVAAPIYRPYLARLSTVKPRGTSAGAGRLEALKDSVAAQRVLQWAPAGLRTLMARGGRTIRRPYHGNGYGHEAAEAIRCITAGLTESPLMPLDQSIEIMDVIDAARAAFH